MRPIKFRGWNKTSKIMVDLKKITPLALDAGMADTDGIFIPFGDYLDLMQFTGLHDKNGKEIYEGDILSNDVARWQVVFNRGCFCHKMIGRVSDSPYFTELALRSLIGGEIIGNIYENEDLLK